MTLLLVVVLIFLLNLFFGYWRANTSRFSPQWLLAIHIPVPLAIVIRLGFLDWSWATLPVFVAAFFGGQYAGGKLRGFLVGRVTAPLSSCLVMDVVRRLSPAG